MKRKKTIGGGHTITIPHINIMVDKYMEGLNRRKRTLLAGFKRFNSIYVVGKMEQTSRIA